MNLGALIGFVLGVALLFFAAYASAASAGVGLGGLVDIVSFLIVVGGAMAATMIAFPMKEFLGAMGGFTAPFKTQGFTMKDVVQDYVNLAEYARKGELAKALEETPEHMPFRLSSIKRGMQMIVDGMSKDDIREIMENIEQYRAIREIKNANAMAKIGEYAPSFGMIGTLFGLIFMLGGMAVPPAPGEDPVAKLTSSMAVALVTTLYGAMFAFFIFMPFSDYMKYINEEKKVESAIHLEGILMLYDKIHPMLVRDKLNAFLDSKDRLKDE